MQSKMRGICYRTASCLTAPVGIESRSDFVKRLRRTVNWMSANARKHGRELCRNQKKRATQVKKLKGARCSF